MKNSRKVLGLLVAFVVLGLMLFSVPAKAFVLNLELNNNKVSQGDNVVFNASLDIKQNEMLPVFKMVLELVGPEYEKCEFSYDGVILSGCKGMSIKVISLPSKSYGYGYGYYDSAYYNFGYGYEFNTGKIQYQITLDTSNYKIGDYKTKLTAYIGNNSFSQNGNVLTIGDSGSSENNNIINDQRVNVCVNGYKCSAWSECIDDRQTRTCSLVPNCYLDSLPLKERTCSASTQTQTGVMKLFTPYSQLRIGNYQSNDETSSDNSMLAVILLISAIIILILILLLVVLTRRARIRRKILKKRKELKRIMYNPNSDNIKFNKI